LPTAQHALFKPESMTEFIGHFHPVLVHLPIGILLMAVLFQFLSHKEKYQSLRSAIGVSLFFGMISAMASCISGFFLSQSGDYDEQLLSQHQWLGIATALLSVLAYFFYKKENKLFKWAMLLMALLIIVTGHWGGSITHGSGYLTKALFNNDSANTSALVKPIANIQEALLYADVVKPILQSKCYSCHGANKQKGKLRLDETGFILKGGKDGAVIVSGKTAESELIKRILLPAENEDHMPPKEKPQLSKQEIDLLHWWTGSGAAFDKKIKELPQSEKIKPILAALQSGQVNEVSTIPAIPAASVKKANDSVLLKLKAVGVVICPVSQNSNYVAANFITANFTDKDLALLEQVKEQLIWLKLGNTNISDASLNRVSKLTGLAKLYLENTAISDKGIEQLKSLTQLQYLNITGTRATANGLMQLKELKKLQQIFLYNSGVTGRDYANIKTAFPKTLIDTGGYKTAMLATDTMLVLPPLH
jgi:uncharacterized membrane protein/mono/diheme cytochrome c family protein